MTDERRTSPELSAAGERLLSALGNVASDLHAAEALSELGDRARHIVAELAKNTRRRAEEVGVQMAAEAASRASSFTSEQSQRGAARHASEPPRDLVHRLDELRACVAEVTDVLEGLTERLATVEMQLGDPDESVERTLRDSIERCELLLAGIEHRVELVRIGHACPDESPGGAGAAPAVETLGARPKALVVAARSEQRARLCVGLEKHGFSSIAAIDLAHAVRAADAGPVDVALLVADGLAPSAALLFEEWQQRRQAGPDGAAGLPRAAVVVAAGDRVAADEVRTYGFAAVQERHGAAAMAAALSRLLEDEAAPPADAAADATEGNA